MSHLHEADSWRKAGQVEPSQSQVFGRNARQAAAAMFLLNGGLFGVWASRIPSFVDRFQISPSLLGLLLLGMATGGIASFPVAGRLSDRYGASVITRRVALLYVASLCLVGLAPSAIVLALCIVLFGAMQGALDVTMNAWGAEVERQLERPILSSLHAMFSLGAGLGAVSGYLAVRYSLSTNLHFLWAGLVLGLGSSFFARGPWPTPATAAEGSNGLVLPRGSLAVVGLVAACATLSEGALADWSGVFLHTVSRLTEAQSALGYAAFSAAMVVMRLTGDRIVHRWGAGWSARVGGGVAALGVLLAVSGQGTYVVLAGFALMGVGFANIAPLAFARAGSDSTLAPGAAIAAVATFGYGGLLLGPPLIGWLAGATSLVFGFGLLAGLALLICLFGSYLETPRTVSEQSRTDSKDGKWNNRAE